MLRTPSRALRTLPSLACLGLAGALLAAAPAGAAPGGVAPPELGPTAYSSGFAPNVPIPWRAVGATTIDVAPAVGPTTDGRWALTAFAPSPEVPTVRSPRSWAGDRSAALGGGVQVVVKPSSATAVTVDLALRGDGDRLTSTTPLTPPDPDDGYSTVTAPLQPTVWRDEDGEPVTTDELEDVLHDLDGVDVGVPVVPTSSAPAGFLMLSAQLAGPSDVVLRRVGTSGEDDRVRGQVSPAGPCVVDQRLVLLRLVDGDERRVAQVRTRRLGVFSFGRPDLPAGRYLVRAPRSTAGDLTCSAAESPPFRLR